MVRERASQAALQRLADAVVNKLRVKRGGKDPGIFSRRYGETLVVAVVVDVQELGTTQPPIKCRRRRWMFSYENYLTGIYRANFGVNRMRNTNR